MCVYLEINQLIQVKDQRGVSDISKPPKILATITSIRNSYLKKKYNLWVNSYRKSPPK